MRHAPRFQAICYYRSWKKHSTFISHHKAVIVGISQWSISIFYVNSMSATFTLFVLMPILNLLRFTWCMNSYTISKTLGKKADSEQKKYKNRTESFFDFHPKIQYFAFSFKTFFAGYKLPLISILQQQQKNLFHLPTTVRLPSIHFVNLQKKSLSSALPVFLHKWCVIERSEHKSKFGWLYLTYTIRTITFHIYINTQRIPLVKHYQCHLCNQRTLKKNREKKKAWRIKWPMPLIWIYTFF